MKRLFFIPILLLLFDCNVNAQDLVLTSDNDTINCKITKVDSKYVYVSSKTIIENNIFNNVDFYTCQNPSINNPFGFVEENKLGFQTMNTGNTWDKRTVIYALNMKNACSMYFIGLDIYGSIHGNGNIIRNRLNVIILLNLSVALQVLIK